MSEQQEPRLPQSFWGAVSAGQPAQLAQTQSPIEQWRHTFEALGWRIEDAMQRFYGQTSQYLDPPQELHTPEQIYKHLMMLDDLGDEAAKPPTSSPTSAQKPKKEPDPQEVALQEAANKATEEWHNAVDEMRTAIASWEQYVKAKREAKDRAKIDLNLYRSSKR
jgi:hypothetical protein